MLPASFIAHGIMRGSESNQKPKPDTSRRSARPRLAMLGCPGLTRPMRLFKPGTPTENTLLDRMTTMLRRASIESWSRLHRTMMPQARVGHNMRQLKPVH